MGRIGGKRGTHQPPNRRAWTSGAEIGRNRWSMIGESRQVPEGRASITIDPPAMLNNSQIAVLFGPSLFGGCVHEDETSRNRCAARLENGIEVYLCAEPVA